MTPSQLKNNLYFLYFAMKASETLLRVAAVYAKDPELHVYYADHLEEEKGHDKWLRADLNELGVEVDDHAPHPMASAMAGNVYYHVRHNHPCALLGYLAVMEGNPASPEMLEAARKACDGKGMATLEYHAKHDVDHSKELFAFIDKLPEWQRKIVFDVAAQTVTFFNIAAKEF